MMSNKTILNWMGEELWEREISPASADELLDMGGVVSVIFPFRSVEYFLNEDGELYGRCGYSWRAHGYDSITQIAGACVVERILISDIPTLSSQEVDNDTFVVSFVSWRSGDFSFFAAPTFDELYSDMAELFREVWEEEFLGDTPEGEPPEDDEECVRLYFDKQSHRLDGDWYAAEYLQLSEVMG